MKGPTGQQEKSVPPGMNTSQSEDLSPMVTFSGSSSVPRIRSFCSHFAICVIGNSPATGSWGIPTIFGNEKAANGNVLNRGHSEPVQGASEPSIANIQLREVSSELLYLETGRIL